MLRVKELATAEMMTEQLQEVDIFSLMQVSGTSDSADPDSEEHFTSRNEDRISVVQAPLITPADIVTLPKGQAFALLEGGTLYKIRMPLPDAADDPAMPTDLNDIATQMQRGYITSDSWWQTSATPISAMSIPVKPATAA